MKKSKLIILSILYDSIDGLTESEILNTTRTKCGTYQTLSSDLQDLINDNLVKHHDTVYDSYTLLELTTKGRQTYEQESESRLRTDKASKSHKRELVLGILVTFAAAAFGALFQLFI